MNPNSVNPKKKSMKKITLLLLISIVTSTMMAQTVFNWKAESISPGNNLQQMHLYEDQSAIIIGNSAAFSKYDPTEKTWSSLKPFTPTFDFIDLSIKNGMGFLSSRRAKMINNPSGGNDDLYANGMFLKTVDNGASWTSFDLSGLAAIAEETLNPLDHGSLAMDIFANEIIDENNILLYSGWYDYRTESKVSRGAVFASTDAGVSWAPITEDLGSLFVTAIYNNGTYNLIGGNNLLRKHITGETETTDLYPALTVAAGDDPTIYIFDITIVDASTFYVVTSTNGIYLTTDGGTSFAPLAGGPGGSYDFYVHSSDVMISLGSGTKSIATIDGGTTWNNCYPGVSCWEIAGVFNGYLYALAKSDVYKLAISDLEAGTYNWTSVEVSSGFNLQKMHIIDDNNALIIGSGQSIKMTTDGGTTWESVECPEAELPIAEEVDFNTLGVSGDLSIAGARRFRLINYPTGSDYTDFSIDGLLLKSTDNWETWSILDITEVGEITSEDASLNPSLDVCYGSDPYTLAVLNSTTILVWINWYERISETEKVTHSRIFKTTDLGETWNSISDDFGSSFITDINFLDENFGIVTGNNVLLKTIDGGENFTDLYPTLALGSDGSMFLKGATIIDADEFYITTSSDGVFKTTDGGANFTKFDGVAGSNDFIKLDNVTYMALGISSKSYYSNTAGASWENCYPGSSIWSIGPIMNDSLYALAKGNVFKIALADIISTVGIGTLDKPNAISVHYLTESIELISSEAIIDQCILYQISGKVISSYSPKSNTYKINTSTLPGGIYIAVTKVNGKYYTNKLLVK